MYATLSSTLNPRSLDSQFSSQCERAATPQEAEFLRLPASPGDFTRGDPRLFNEIVRGLLKRVDAGEREAVIACYEAETLLASSGLVYDEDIEDQWEDLSPSEKRLARRNLRLFESLRDARFAVADATGDEDTARIRVAISSLRRRSRLTRS